MTFVSLLIRMLISSLANVERARLMHPRQASKMSRWASDELQQRLLRVRHRRADTIDADGIAQDVIGVPIDHDPVAAVGTDEVARRARSADGVVGRIEDVDAVAL